LIACLRSQKFWYLDRTACVTVELRRLHDTDAQCDNKQFVVTKRFSGLPMAVVNKTFGTLPEARRWWMEQVTILEDQGLIPAETKFLGFREED